MKRTLMAGTLVFTLVALTGCGSKKTLTCTKTSSDNGFTNEWKEVYNFEGNKITKSEQTTTIVLEGDFSENFDYYKDNANSIVEDNNKKNGIESSVNVEGNSISVTTKYTPSEMDDEDYTTYKMGENYDSMKAIKTDQEGYTCK